MESRPCLWQKAFLSVGNSEQPWYFFYSDVAKQHVVQSVQSSLFRAKPGCQHATQKMCNV